MAKRKLPEGVIDMSAMSRKAMPAATAVILRDSKYEPPHAGHIQYRICECSDWYYEMLDLAIRSEQITGPGLDALVLNFSQFAERLRLRVLELTPFIDEVNAHRESVTKQIHYTLGHWESNRVSDPERAERHLTRAIALAIDLVPYAPYLFEDACYKLVADRDSHSEEVNQILLVLQSAWHKATQTVTEAIAK